MYISSLDNQFSFKHGINICICGLKKTVNLYRTKNSSVLMCFIDVCKAFDRANHRKLLVNLNNVFLGTLWGFSFTGMLISRSRRYTLHPKMQCQMFVSVGVCTLKALFRKLMFTFIESLNGSANSIILALMNPTVNFSCYSSSLMNQWLKCLCKLISYNCAMCNIRFVFIVDSISNIVSCFKYIYTYIYILCCAFSV